LPLLSSRNHFGQEVHQHITMSSPGHSPSLPGNRSNNMKERFPTPDGINTNFTISKSNGQLVSPVSAQANPLFIGDGFTNGHQHPTHERHDSILSSDLHMSIHGNNQNGAGIGDTAINPRKRGPSDAGLEYPRRRATIAVSTTFNFLLANIYLLVCTITKAFLNHNEIFVQNPNRE
jgi:hypothetical protein